MSEAVCSSSEIPEGSAKAFTVKGEKLIIFHLSDGFHATQSSCTHLFWPLTKGKILDDTCVQCPFHRAKFDIRTGEVKEWALFPPGIQMLNAVRGEKALKTWPVSEQDGQLFVTI